MLPLWMLVPVIGRRSEAKLFSFQRRVIFSYAPMSTRTPPVFEPITDASLQIRCTNAPGCIHAARVEVILPAADSLSAFHLHSFTPPLHPPDHGFLRDLDFLVK